MSRLRGLSAWQQHCRLVEEARTFYGASLPEQEQTQKTGGLAPGCAGRMQQQGALA